MYFIYVYVYIYIYTATVVSFISELHCSDFDQIRHTPLIRLYINYRTIYLQIFHVQLRIRVTHTHALHNVSVQ